MSPKPSDSSSDILALDPEEITRFLVRQRRHDADRLEIRLDAFLKEILAKANEFVPSESGSILLDDPRAKMGGVGVNTLTFIAVFGVRSDRLLGRSIAVDRGIAGHVYSSGQPHIAQDVREDEYFYPSVDEQSGYQTLSIIAVPVIVGDSICGVLELLNRVGEAQYSRADLDLLETFAGYISSSIQNALDTMRARELARRDDLTGLFNDRFLHVRLADEVRRAEKDETHLSVVFLDLDFFKRINDRYGHLVGSQVLREVGHLLAKWLPPGAFAARYGGDEFVVVLPGYNSELAEQSAESLRCLVEANTYLMDGYRELGKGTGLHGMVTASLGVSSLHQHVPPVGTFERRQNSLIRLADTAMYEAKNQGKNRVLVAEPEA